MRRNRLTLLLGLAGLALAPVFFGAALAGNSPAPKPVPFTSLPEYVRALERRLASETFLRGVENSLQRSWKKARGRV